VTSDECVGAAPCSLKLSECRSQVNVAIPRPQCWLTWLFTGGTIHLMTLTADMKKRVVSLLLVVRSRFGSVERLGLDRRPLTSFIH